MKTKHVDYTDDLFTTAVDNQPPRVYLVDSYTDKQAAKQQYQPPLLTQESLFLTREELKEKLFLTEKLVLKEEKLVLMFYEVLTERDKQQLEINNYFDVIDLANDFLDFYDQLTEYQIEQIDNLADWQQRKYEILQSIRTRYQAALEEQGYTDRTLANDFDNFSLQFISDYHQLVAVNILDFTPLEKEMLTKIEAAGVEVTHYCQLASCDWDQEQLTLQSVTLPDRLEPDLEIYKTEERFLEIINWLDQLEQRKADYEVLTADDSSDYNKLLSEEYFDLNKEFDFTATKLYRFLESLHTLLVSSDQARGELKLDLAELREASYRSGFRDYYGLSRGSIRRLNQLAKQGYVYISNQLITTKDETDELQVFKQVVSDIKQINQFTNLTQFINWLTELKVEVLTTNKFKDDIANYFAALSELKALSKLKIVSSWRKYFDNLAGGLFNLILRYLKFKPLTPNISQVDEKIEINDLATASYQSREQLILLNIIEGIIPSRKQTGFLLTDQQQQELGLPSRAKKRLLEEYKFFRSILSTQQVIIFTLKNEEQNITPSSFVERLLLNYDLSLKEAPINGQNYNLIMQQLFASKAQLEDILPADSNFELSLEDNDFKADCLPLGYYRYRTLQDCYCKFYLQHQANLEPEREPIEKKLSPKTLGILVHNIFEAVVSTMQNEIKSGSSAVKLAIEEIVEQEIANQQLKIPNYYAAYYQKVLFPAVKEAVVDFLTKLETNLTGEVTEVLVEWEPTVTTSLFTYNQIDVLLTGRIDLAVKTTAGYYLVDYKTGRGREEQLDFYSLLFADQEQETKIERSIYNVLEQKFTYSKADSPVEFKEKLIEEVTNFLESSVYHQAANYQCTNCQYQAICKVVRK